MKYLRILLDPIKIKGDLDDLETLGFDIMEKVTAMAEAGTLGWSIDEEDGDDEEDY